MGENCKLGMGVMLQMLFRDHEKGPDPLADVRGHVIKSVRIDDDANGGDGALVFAFASGWG